MGRPTRSRGKGAKIAKGQSSSSNPRTRKHRDKARAAFMVSHGMTPDIPQQNTQQAAHRSGKLLTTEALAIHNIVQNSAAKGPETRAAMMADIQRSERRDRRHGNDGMDTDGDVSQAQTAISAWSDALSESPLADAFESVLEKANSPLPVHQEAVAVLSAVQDVIKTKEGAETPTAYFASFMTVLETQLTAQAEIVKAESVGKDGGSNVNATVTDASGKEGILVWPADEEAMVGSNTKENSGGHGMPEATGKGVDALAATMHLLTLVVPRLPASLARSKLQTAAAVFLMAYEGYGLESQAIGRSCVTIVGRLLEHQSMVQWEQPNTQKLYTWILDQTASDRPKIRKAANNAVHRLVTLAHQKMVTTGDKNPSRHPVIRITGASALESLKTASRADLQKTLYMLGMLKDVLALLGPKNVKAIVEGLLWLMTLGNSSATIQTLQVLEEVFKEATADDLMAQAFRTSADANDGHGNDDDEDVGDHIDEKDEERGVMPDSAAAQPLVKDKQLMAQVVLAIVAHRPNLSDALALAQWLLTVVHGMVVLSKADERKCLDVMPKVVASITECFLSEKRSVAKVTGSALKTILEECVAGRDQAIAEAAQAFESNEKTRVGQVIDRITGCLQYKFNASWSVILQVHAVLFTVLGPHTVPLASNSLKAIVDFRNDEDFQHKKEIEGALQSAMRALGPEQFFATIPAGIPSDSPEKSNYWLLSIVHGHIKHAELRYFIDDLMPAAMRCKADESVRRQKKELIAAKALFDIYALVWALFPGFCNVAVDVPGQFQRIAKRLGVMLQQDASVRKDICFGLAALINTHSDIANGDVVDDTVDAKSAQDSLDAIRPFCKNFLPILFNLCIASAPEDRNHLLVAVRALVSIANEQILLNIFKTVMNKLLTATERRASETNPAARKALSIELHGLADLIQCFIPRLPGTAVELLYRAVLPFFKDNSDGIMQKKSYRILQTVAKRLHPDHAPFLLQKLDTIVADLTDTSIATQASAKRDRLALICELIPSFGPQHFSLLPDLLPEVILATKEVSERTRHAAFDVLITFGGQFEAYRGVTFKLVVPGDDESGEPSASEEREASLQEYVTMVAAGAAGESTQMVAGTLLALSRLVYEFKPSLPVDFIQSLLGGILPFLLSRTKEVVKGALTFVKVAIGALDVGLLQPYLQEMIKGMTEWTQEANSAFMRPRRHILERLARKYGNDYIASLMPEEHKKLIRYIEKEQIKSRRKKIEARQRYEEAQAQQSGTVPANLRKNQHAKYEYELGDSDDEGHEHQGPGGSAAVRQARSNQKAYIRDAVDNDEDVADDDEVMDFLDRNAVSKVFSSKPRRNVRSHAADEDEFGHDDFGRMKIDDPEAAGKDDADNDSLVADSDDEFGPMLRKKSSRKRAMELDGADLDDDDDDGEAMGRGGGVGGQQAEKRRAAGGDQRRRGEKHDPYAYVPLSSSMLNRRIKKKGGAGAGLRQAVKGQNHNLTRTAKKAKARHAALKQEEQRQRKMAMKHKRR
eukprot:Clim_evm68s146 gene=Clim_evmTU68s146